MVDAILAAHWPEFFSNRDRARNIMMYRARSIGEDAFAREVLLPTAISGKPSLVPPFIIEPMRDVVQLSRIFEEFLYHPA